MPYMPPGYPQPGMAPQRPPMGFSAMGEAALARNAPLAKPIPTPPPLNLPPAKQGSWQGVPPATPTPNAMSSVPWSQSGTPSVPAPRNIGAPGTGGNIPYSGGQFPSQSMMAAALARRAMGNPGNPLPMQPQVPGVGMMQQPRVPMPGSGGGY